MPQATIQHHLSICQQELMPSCVTQLVGCTCVHIVLARLQVALDGIAERIRQQLVEDATLAGLSKSATNAFRLYKRTRPAASAESLARTRLQAPEGVHPLLAAAIPASALAGLEAQVSLA